MLGADDVVYAVAQGPSRLGDFSGHRRGGRFHGSKESSHGGHNQRGCPGRARDRAQIVSNKQIELLLLNPDYASAARAAEAINNVFPHSAIAKDASTINICVPDEYTGYEVNFVASVGAIEVIPDNIARVVINERTGTIIATATVRISTVAVSHGSLTINIASTQAASQPNPFSSGTTAHVKRDPDIGDRAKGGFKVVDELPTIQEVASAMNALGLSTRDMMAIFQAMKTAGALQADLILE